MTTLLSDAAAAMSKAAHAKLTPEARRERASKLAAARWKKHKGLTQDQKRVLAKLARYETAKISIPASAGGVRVARAVQALEDRGLVTDVIWGWIFARYSRGPKWTADAAD